VWTAVASSPATWSGGSAARSSAPCPACPPCPAWTACPAWRVRRAVRPLAGQRQQDREDHQPRAVRGRHQERPDGEVQRPHAHPAPPGVAAAQQSEDPEPQQQRRHSPLQVRGGERRPHQHRQHGHAADGGGVTPGQGQERPPDGAARPLLQPQGDREQPAHPGVDPVHGPEEQEPHPGPGRLDHEKQNESEEASPPSSLTWCGRSPSSNSTRKRGSNAIPPSAPASSRVIHPRMPSG
jgi:hypothetical protein